MLEKTDRRRLDRQENFVQEKGRDEGKAALQPAGSRKVLHFDSRLKPQEADADEKISIALQEKIISFLYDLAQRPDKFIENLMHLLHKHFNFKNAWFLYPINIYDLKNTYASGEFYTDCMGYYITDGIVKVAPKHKSDRFPPANLLSHDSMPAEFHDKIVIVSSEPPKKHIMQKECDYFHDFSNQCSFKFFATMKLAFPENTYLGRITFAKTDAEGDFTDDERYILNKIAGHISHSYYFAIDYYYKVEKIKLFYMLNSHLHTGLIAVNSKLQVFCANKISYQYCYDILIHNKIPIPKDSNNKKIMQQILVNMLSDNITSVLNEGYTKFICSKYVYTLNGVSCVMQDYKNDLTPYYFFYIEREKNNDDTIFKMFSNKYNLSSRELEILTMLDRGSNAKTISAELYISRHTVKTHIANIFRKVNVGCRAALLHMLRNDKQDDLLDCTDGDIPHANFRTERRKRR
ncbi:MAG: helix-turn-helix transcriptional regulator [Desulfovibrio sp.]|jgi:DNA-binding CsgD family transcriptional regulator|nr:helix-turn-helix transcriptional regulator [Desulfovibrio sp.]